MPTSIEVKHITEAERPPIRVLLAESDLVEIDRIISTIDPKFHYGINIVNNYHELLESIARERPQLVVLGKIDKSSYSDIARDCHKIRKNLQIFLLSSQGLILDSFRQLVKACGLTDVILKDPSSLNKLLEAAEQHARQYPTHKLTDKSSMLPYVIGELLRKPSFQATQERSTNESIEPPSISGRIMLAALAEIVAISNNYFGPLAQGNYWRKAHERSVDEFPSLQDWSADHFSKLSCNEKILERPLTAEDIHSLRLWVQYFLEECERIIVDFRKILNDADLSPPAKDLLNKS